MKVVNIASAVAGAVLRVGIAIFAVYFIYQGAEICYDYGFRIFTEPAVSTQEGGRTVTVSVTDEMSPWDIGELFEKRGLVKDGKLFALQYYLSEYYKDAGPGMFELSTSMTAEEMMEVMALNSEKKEEEPESK